ncbi:D-amino-acid oxidase [Kwoniella heveanensis BCC8398]|uniref:D-amino-acid oxidase n=1 Tax=Kwoniella heveanensis BCC8398 TaxID=1296120 RepID=A0A1B9GQT0_9TREE|nr:D-amino-acid oxidase [Kwoniella heveanensis BCC8398]
MPTSNAATKGRYDAVVLGCGVLGLSIAHELTDRGLKVAVVGKELPEDVESTGFASPWAGANWHSFGTTAQERKREEITFRHFERLSQEIPDLCERRQYDEYFSLPGKKDEEVPWYRDLMFGWRTLSPSEIPSPYKYGVTYESYTLNAPLYLQHLARTLRAKGVPILRHRLSSLDEAYNLSTVGPVDLVINATGLGARSLIGVEDKAVFPAKGQTVLVRAPAVKTCYGQRDNHPVPNQKIYIIPRPGPKHHVILGGCYLAHDWSTNIDPAISELILKDCHKLCPQLDGKGGKGTWKDIDIVSHNVGLRPVREGGMRLELEERSLGKSGNQDLIPTKGKQGSNGSRKVAVVHAYGIGPAGYQASLGISEEVGGIVQAWWDKNGGRKKGVKAKL